MFKEIDPATTGIGLAKVRHVRNGGVLIGCSSDNDLQKFRNLAREKLSEKYDVKSIRGINPRIRVTGISELHSEATLLYYVKTLNPLVFREDSECRLLKLYAELRIFPSSALNR